MEKNQAWKRIEFSDRLISRIQKRGTRGNLVKSIAELIKNSDDSYYRLEAQKIETAGRIEIGYWYNNQKKRRFIAGFYVRDWAEGMTKDLVTRAYDITGENTSKGARSGAIGVGGKDALYGMKECYIISIHQGNAIAFNVRTNTDGVMEKGETYEGASAQSAIDTINSQIKRLEPIETTKNGTIVLFTIPEERKHPQLKKFKEDLESYYTLRNILRDKSRIVRLVNIHNGDSTIVRYVPIPGRIVETRKDRISYNGKSYPIQIQLRRSEKDLNKDREYGFNILIEDERGAILDNTLFHYQDSIHARKIFGTITIENWRELYEIDQTILTDNREGLDYNNSFNQELRAKILYSLNPLVENEKKNAGPRPSISGNIKKRIMEVFSYFNKIIEQEVGGGFNVDDPVILDFQPEDIQFSQSSLSLHVGEEREIKIYYNKEKVINGSKIELTCAGKGIFFNPHSIVVPSEGNNIGNSSIVIIGRKVGAQSILTATSGDFKTSLFINVIPAERFEPNNGFAFVPEKVTLTSGRRGRLKLLYDTRVIKQGTIIKVTSEDDKIKLANKKYQIGSPNLDKFIGQELVEITSNVAGIKSKITASVNTPANELMSTCDVRVIEKDSAKKFLKDIKFDNEKDGHQRASFDKGTGTVYIHVNSPILKKYFGDDGDRLNSKKEKDAVAILADTVLQCVSRNMAKHLIDSGAVPQIRIDDPEEIENVRNNLEYVHGQLIHRMITESPEIWKEISTQRSNEEI